MVVGCWSSMAKRRETGPLEIQTINIIPDIHADPERLELMLGLVEDGSRIAFLGDFIDHSEGAGSADDEAVLKRVRQLMDDKDAVAVMGNHELNAILFHREIDGMPLRERSKKNRKQHNSFIDSFGTASQEAKYWTDFFLTLPLWLQLDGVRLVHACWSDKAISVIAERRPDGRLQEEDLPEVAAKKSVFANAVEMLLSGPECRLPEPFRFRDIKGEFRRDVRIAWWRPEARTWREAGLSVGDINELPDEAIPESCNVEFYPNSAPPVFFGHYKIKDTPKLEGYNVACIDYPDSPCTYTWMGEGRLIGKNLIEL